MKVRVCTSVIYPREIPFASQSMPGVTHTVISSTIFNDTICTCIGWHNRGYCSHQKQVDETQCNWVGSPAAKYSTTAEEMECPKCGAPVEDYELEPELV